MDACKYLDDAILPDFDKSPNNIEVKDMGVTG